MSNAWRYFGRADDVLVLNNGEKVSPTSIESTLRSSPLVNDVAVFGSNQSALCAFVYVNKDQLDPSFGSLNSPSSRAKLLTHLKPVIDRANAFSPSFAQLNSELIAFCDDLDSSPRTSKGTVRRSVAEKVFADRIQQLYCASANSTSPSAGIQIVTSTSQEQIVRLVQDVIEQVLSRRPGVDQELFDFGVTSLQAMRIRARLVSSTGIKALESNVVFEYPTTSL